MSHNFIRHKHTAEFLKDVYIHLQESDSNPLSGPVRNGYFQFIVVSQQFNCTTSTRPFVGEFRVTLPSFDDLTFLDKIVLRDTRWRDALGKMYVMWMYAYVPTPLFSKVWPPPSLLGDMDLNTHFLKILKRPTLRRCSEYRHRTTCRSVAHTSVSQVRLGTTNQNGAGFGKMTGQTWCYLSRIRNVSWKSQCIMCVKYNWNIIMSLNSIIMLIRVFSDIMMHR